MTTELQKYDISPQEQVAVALYMKTLNKTQAARDAGFSTTHVFQKPAVQAAIADLMKRRAERLLVGSEWVLVELMRVYERCMTGEKILDPYGNVIGEKWDSRGALRAIDLIGKHCDVQAFTPAVEDSADSEIVAKIRAGRKRVIERIEQESDTPKKLSFI